MLTVFVCQFERQSEREETLMMTEKVDQEWRDMQFTLGINKVRNNILSHTVQWFSLWGKRISVSAQL